MRDQGRGQRVRGWGEALRRWASRSGGRPGAPRAAAPPAPPVELAAAQHESVVTLSCVVERTQALVKQLEAELQSERALMSAKLERLAAENRLLLERLRERQGETGHPGAAAPARPGPGRVSPFRRGLRGH